MKHTAHYISGTHWDREWYRPFEEYRLLLVRLVDTLLDLMETNAAFRYFQFDGQTVMLDDYLAIRPQQRERLARLIREGRILIGPWYTMPDLFCPDGESIVRNLLRGRQVAREWATEGMPVGYICDMFGHPSQMPQIFAGFGLRDIVLGRGTNESTTDMFFEWMAPDGTAALTFKLQDKVGYGAFALPRAILENNAPEVWQHIQGYEAYEARLRAAEDDPDRLNAIREDWGREALAGYIDYEKARANLPVLAVMDTMDHVLPATDVARYLRLIRESCPGVEASHSNLPAFFRDVRERAAGATLRRKHGELREPSREKCGYLYLIPNCVSARVGLKLAGDAAATLLERWAEPLLALAGEKTADLRPFLERAWTQVLSNHAHDSVCGCSIDQVHRDMQYRFDQARVLGEQLRHQALAALTADGRDLAVAKDDVTLTLFNPLPIAVDEALVFDVDLPPDYPAVFREGFRSQELKHFVLEDAAGRNVPYQRLAVVPAMNERTRLARYCHISDGPFARYTVAASVPLPGLGYTSLRLKPATRPVRPVGSLRTGPVSAENAYLGLTIAPNGTLTLTDKRGGQVYRDLLTFEDRGEIGDGWFHGHAVNDAPTLSTAAAASVRVVHDGPEIVTFRIETTLRVPERYDWHAERPSETCVDLRIASEVSLRRGACVVDVSTRVDNNAQDHRLQVLLPTDATDAQTYLAHTAFDVVERPIALDPATHDWQEMDIVEKPFESVQAVGTGERGLAFLSGGGLHEGGIRDDRRRTMQVTLLRGFRRTVGTDGEADGLELGRRIFRYALMPYRGAFPAVAALHEAARRQAGILTRQTGQRPSGYPPMAGDAPATRGFLEQDGPLVLSAIKPAEDGSAALILRWWNPADAPVAAALRFDRPVAAATACRLDESPDPEAPAPVVTGASVTFQAAPRRIVTLRVERR